MAPQSVRRRSLSFTRLSLSNWRNFVEVDVPLQKRAFIVGPNASGKSNLLDAFRFLRDLASSGGGLQQAVGSRGGVSRIRCLAARRYPSVELDLTITDTDATGAGEDGDEWRYLLRFKQDNQQTPLVEAEQVWRSGKQILSRPGSDGRRFGKASSPQSSAANDLGDGSRHPLRIAFLGGSRCVVARASLPIGPVSA